MWRRDVICSEVRLWWAGPGEVIGRLQAGASVCLGPQCSQEPEMRAGRDGPGWGPQGRGEAGV